MKLRDFILTPDKDCMGDIVLLIVSFLMTVFDVIVLFSIIFNFAIYLIPAIMMLNLLLTGFVYRIGVAK